jgi:putative ABC transport system permease protein
MTSWTLALRGLVFYARSHLGALLGAAVGSAVLVGALVVGDSVRGSLREMALARLGKVDVALASNDRLFRQELARELGASLKGLVAPVLQLPGTATTGNADSRANQVQVLGVDERFWKLAKEAPGFSEIAPGSVVLNEQLAARLEAKPGDSLVFRVRKPTALSQDAPLSPSEDTLAALRLTVQEVVSDSRFGRFSLHASQLPPLNAYLSLATLSSRVGATNRANLLLAGGTTDGDATLSVGAAEEALKQSWQLSDGELRLIGVPDGKGAELRTARVFIDPPVAKAAFEGNPRAQGILTYFVNELRIGDRVTPYSMVTAAGAPWVPADLGGDEIVVSRWLAEDLNARVGDSITLRYYVVGLRRKLEERESVFRVRSVLPDSEGVDAGLMPDFPGLTDAENCRDWDTGFPIDLDRIREKDNAYWETYKGTPKAFISLAAGKRLWGNRFGELTAIRFPDRAADATFAGELQRSIEPASLGLRFEPIREMALAASSESQDFGQLFLGFSFFLIVAALMLMGLLFRFGIEQRRGEIGTLLALGFQPRQVRSLLLREGILIATVGGAIGVLGGVLYARAMLMGLATVWKGAVGTTSLSYHAGGATLVTGALAGVVVATLTIWMALRTQGRQPTHQLLSETAPEGTVDTGWSKQRTDLISRLCLIVAAGLVVVKGKPEGAAGAETFFLAGSLLLIGGIAQCASFLSSLGGTDHAAKLALVHLAVRNATRRRQRSLATIGLLACGSFLIMSIGVFRLDSRVEQGDRSSGTGGFALIGESTHPVVQDLNSEAGREWYGIEPDSVAGVEAVPLRVLEGEDASCLNLNRAQKPRLLGVQPELLQKRGAFTFAQVMEGLSSTNQWALLNSEVGPGEVAGIGDQASIQWALGRKVGDALAFTDEQGREFKVRIVASVANSILQGNLLIAEDRFVERFPSTSGYRMFLIDAPNGKVEAVSKTLSQRLQDAGLEIEPTVRRLSAFNAVQNTYLGTFQILGGLGLLLGSVGLGVVVLRNVLERKGELALLLAVGFRRDALGWCVLSEHLALLVMGLGVGTVSALIAVLPTLLTPGAQPPYGSLFVTLVTVLLSGVVWTWGATKLALRGRLLNALRNE